MKATADPGVTSTHVDIIGQSLPQSPMLVLVLSDVHWDVDVDLI